MKKKFFFALCMLLVVLFTASAGDYAINYSQQSNGRATLIYTLGSYELTEKVIKGESYTVLLFDGGVSLTKKGYAELPVINTALQLTDANNISVEVDKAEYVDISVNAPMLPARGVIYRDQDKASIPYIINQDSYKEGFYPAQVTETGRPYIIRDVRGTNVLLYPFQYNAATQTLRVYKKITVNLSDNDKAPVNSLSRKSNKVLGVMSQVYRSIFKNYSVSTRDVVIDEVGDILVIYTNRDKDAIQPYIQWKKEKGFKVFEREVSKGTNVDSLIQQEYNANNNILYVQLVGDWADIKGPSNSKGEPLDVKMGCVVGSDDHPDIIIGRYSASNANDVTAQVNKTIKYERNPDLNGDWYHKALGIGGTDGPSDDEGSDWEQVDFIKKNKLLPSTYTEVAEAYKNPSTTSIIDVINTGVSAVNYSNHGYYNSLPVGSISTTVADNFINGDKLFFITAVACWPGNFAKDCLAEHLMKNPNGGAINVWFGSISQPWYPPYYGQDYFNDLLIGGYDYDTKPGKGISTYEGRTTFGSIAYNAGLLMYTEDTSSQSKDTLESWIVFGDAALQVRTDTPALISLSNTEVKGGIPFSTTISSSGNVKGVMVSIYQDGESFSALTDDNGNVSITHPFTTGKAKLVVTGFNLETKYLDIEIGPVGPTPTVTPIYTNVALAKPVTASGEYSGSYPKTAANDGNDATIWGSLYNAGPQWLYYDLGQVYSLDSAQLKFYDPYYSPHYYIGISNDAVNWDFAAEITNGTGGTRIIELLRDARYVGIYLTKGAQFVYGVKEFEVYTKTIPVDPTPTITPTPLHTPTPTATPTATPTEKPWQSGVTYDVGDIVSHNGKLWECTVAHTSNSAWEPGTPGVYLWKGLSRH